VGITRRLRRERLKRHIRPYVAVQGNDHPEWPPGSLIFQGGRSTRSHTARFDGGVTSGIVAAMGLERGTE
jgi:hypothetical protein